MSTTESRAATTTAVPAAGRTDQKLEVVILSVSDADRSKEFYESLGWRLDADFDLGDGYRIIQFTPPGSACSIGFGTRVSGAAPGSAKGLELIVSDIEAAREELVARGVAVGEIFHGSPFDSGRQIAGADPQHTSYRSYAAFDDPDGNHWLLQEVTVRLPGRIDDAGTSFASVADLSSAMRRASVAHGEHEARTGQADANWPDWYAAYMVAELHGAELPT